MTSQQPDNTFDEIFPSYFNLDAQSSTAGAHTSTTSRTLNPFDEFPSTDVQVPTHATRESVPQPQPDFLRNFPTQPASNLAPSSQASDRQTTNDPPLGQPSQESQSSADLSYTQFTPIVLQGPTSRRTTTSANVRTNTPSPTSKAMLKSMQTSLGHLIQTQTETNALIRSLTHVLQHHLQQPTHGFPAPSAPPLSQPNPPSHQSTSVHHPSDIPDEISVPVSTLLPSTIMPSTTTMPPPTPTPAAHPAFDPFSQMSTLGLGTQPYPSTSSVAPSASASIAPSHHSIVHELNKVIATKDKLLKIAKIPTLSASDADLRSWYHITISQISACAFTSALITQGDIDTTHPKTDANQYLYSILSNQSPPSLKILIAADPTWKGLGTKILQFLQGKLRSADTDEHNAAKLFTDLTTMKYNPYKMSIDLFVVKFSTLVERLRKTSLAPQVADGTILRHHWIKTFEKTPAFSVLYQDVIIRENPPDKFKNADSLALLLQATIDYMTRHDIPLSPSTDPSKQQDKKESYRAPVPTGFDSYKAYHKAIEDSIRDGTFPTKKAQYQRNCPNGCLRCLFLPSANNYHKTTDCHALKSLLEPSSSTGGNGTNSRHNNNNTNTTTTNYSTVSIPSSVDVIASVHSISSDTPSHSHPSSPSMLVDSGSTVTIGHLPELFSSLTMYDSTVNQKYIALGDEKTLLRCHGHGTMDILISNHRVKLPAYFVPSIPLSILSIKEHVKYARCSFQGANNTLQIKFPTFHFTIPSDTDFTIPIQPAPPSTPISFDHHTAPLTNAESITANPPPSIPITKSDSSVPTPSRATPGSVGYDIYSPTTITLAPHSTTKIPIGIHIAIPHGLTGVISPRSGLALKGIHVGGGIIDNDYRGEVAVILHNTTPHPFHITKGHKIAQFTFHHNCTPTLIPQDSPLPPTSRGHNGFGSTDTLRAMSFLSETAIPPPHRKSHRKPFTSSLNPIMEIDEPLPSSPPLPTTPLRDPAVVSISSPPPLDDASLSSSEASEMPPLHDRNADLSSDESSSTASHGAPSTPPPANPSPIPFEISIPTPLSPQHSPPRGVGPSNDADISTSRGVPPSSTQPPPAPSPSASPPTPTPPAHPSPIPAIPPPAHPSPANTLPPTPLPATIPNQSSPRVRPRLHPRDKVASTVPNRVAMTTDLLQRCTGFRKVEPIMKHLRSLIQNNITFSDIGKDPILSRGETATMPATRRNTTPIPRPDNISSVFHYDIVYGACTARKGIKYAILLVDRKSRHKYIYSLTDLSDTTILDAMQKFIHEIGRFPDQMIADRDFKLIGGIVAKYLEEGQSIVSGAPGQRQNSNGLSEINWRYLCDIARNYLAENYLPMLFWYDAISKYAVQVSNYLPVKREDGSLTTPFFETFAIKPDYRNLLPLFSPASIRYNVQQSDNTFKTQSCQAILIGNDEKSEVPLFYNPYTKKEIATATYTLDPTHPSGPAFNLKYDGGPNFNLLSPDHFKLRPPSYQLLQEVFLSATHPEYPSLKVTIVDVPHEATSDTFYHVRLPNSGDIIPVREADISDVDPNADSPRPAPILSLPWIQNNAKVTIQLESQGMKEPKQGYLLHDQQADTWSFLPGRKSPHENKNSPIPLHDFINTAVTIFQNKEIMRGWVRLSTFNENYSLGKSNTFLLRRIALTGSSDPQDLSDTAIINKLEQMNVIGHVAKVSATELQCLDPPPSLKAHFKLSPNDKAIWDKSYAEEYYGLHNTTHTWDYISEAEYKRLRHVLGRPLPTMAVSKIKTDENGKPQRAKYRIVALGNLDPHSWSKSDCFAPVLSSVEVRLLISIAVQMKRIPKSADFVQAFCQSFLPENEKYVCTPPKDCPITPPNTYLLLIKTLYGLKRSPRHWYETVTKALNSIGLKALPNSNCIFTGELIPGEPPIYIGIFVDDCLYFSESDAVEKEFERRITEDTDLGIEFNGNLKHFLGIAFDCRKYKDGHVEIFMSQPKDTEDLLSKLNLDNPSAIPRPTPYRSGLPVDSVPDIDLPLHEKQRLQKLLRELVGSYNWLSCQTRPDLSTITNIIAKYCSNPSPGHIDAAKYVGRYLLGTRDLGIKFSSRDNKALESFVKFPTDPSTLLPFCDSNWGPQDASKPNPTKQQLLDLFKSRSISGFVIWLGGPMHWLSKRQTITAGSSPEAEIYAMDQLVKALLHIIHLLKDLNLYHRFTKGDAIPIYNDNAAAVQWSKNMTTKGLRHLQMKENHVREAHQNGHVVAIHQPGKQNPSDMFTKEEQTDPHFIACRDSLMSKPLSHADPNPSEPSSSHMPLPNPNLSPSSVAQARRGVLPGDGQTIASLRQIANLSS